MSFQTERLVRVFRNGVLESEHQGSIAIVNRLGHLMAYAGDPFLTTFLRSCAKPFQAVPVVSSGTSDRFGFTDEEIAVIAGSHSGEPEHVRVVQSILKKIGLSEDALQCGVHDSFNEKSNPTSSQMRNNCSGKHAGMLAVAMDMGLSSADYLETSHPVQKAIIDVISDVTGVAENDLKMGIDGCSAPIFAVPLVAMARAYSRLVSGLNEEPISQPSSPTISSVVGSGRTWTRSDALKIISKAMMAHPFFVAGTKRLDTELMQSFPGKLVSKGGAEGVQCCGVVSSDVNPKNIDFPLGIAIKVADGNAKRTVPFIMSEVLSQLEIFTQEKMSSFKKTLDPIVKNHRNIGVGKVEAVFRLKLAS